MKKLTYILMGTLFLTALAYSNAYAGIDYSQFHQQYRSETSAKAPASKEDKRLEHQSKYQRDQQGIRDNTLPSKDRDLNKPTPRSDVTK